MATKQRLSIVLCHIAILPAAVIAKETRPQDSPFDLSPRAALLEKLRHKDEGVRLTAVKKLASDSNIWSTSVLAATLADESLLVRTAALRDLAGRLATSESAHPDHDLIDRLCTFLHKEYTADVRASAVLALARYANCHAGTRRALIQVVKDKDRDLVGAVCTVLISVDLQDNQRAFAALRDALESDLPLDAKLACAEVLGRNGQDVEDTVMTLLTSAGEDPILRSAGLRALAARGDNISGNALQFIWRLVYDKRDVEALDALTQCVSSANARDILELPELHSRFAATESVRVKTRLAYLTLLRHAVAGTRPDEAAWQDISDAMTGLSVLEFNHRFLVAFADYLRRSGKSPAAKLALNSLCDAIQEDGEQLSQGTLECALYILRQWLE